MVSVQLSISTSTYLILYIFYQQIYGKYFL